MGLLENRVALVGGGGSGIGRAVVDRFLQEGAKVGVLEISPRRVEELSTLGDSIFTIQGDATNFDVNYEAVRRTTEKFGKLDILVCCQGLYDFAAHLTDIPDDKLSDAFDEMFNINVKSYMFATKAAIPELEKTEGCIIYLSSVAGFWPDRGGVLYTTSKFAVRGLVIQMAHELAPKIRVNGLAPGGVPTNLTGLRTLGMLGRTHAAERPDREERQRENSPLNVVTYPADIAWAILYLASKEMSKAVTGTLMLVDGGTSIRGNIRGPSQYPSERRPIRTS